VYNKPNGCSATGALAPGPDHQQQQQQQHIINYIRYNCDIWCGHIFEKHRALSLNLYFSYINIQNHKFGEVSKFWDHVRKKNSQGKVISGRVDNNSFSPVLRLIITVALHPRNDINFTAPH
jgi:hypothetical protein